MEPRGWTGRARGGRAGTLFFALLVRYGGLALAPVFVFWVALYFLVAAPSGRRASFDLADRLGLGGGTWRRLRFAFRHFRTYGTLLVDRLAVLSGLAHRYRFRYHGEEGLRAQALAGKGLLLVTGHVGSWEIMGHLLRRLDAPVALVMHDVEDPAVRASLKAVEDRRSFRVLHTDGSPASAAAILEELARGAIVGMMGDRLLEAHGVAVSFLGSEAAFPVGPYAIAAASGAPLSHVFALRTGRRCYDFHASPPRVLSHGARGGRRADLARWAGEFAARLEEVVREHPTQWGNFYPFWSAPQP
jgi:predicted LPLAT superfamily acyltransferase